MTVARVVKYLDGFAKHGKCVRRKEFRSGGTPDRNPRGLCAGSVHTRASPVMPHPAADNLNNLTCLTVEFRIGRESGMAPQFPLALMRRLRMGEYTVERWP